MKIAVFSTTYFPRTGGAERFVHGLATHLVRAGYEVLVVAPVSQELRGFKPNYRLNALRFLGPFQSFDTLYRSVLLMNLILIYLKERFEILQVVGMYPAGVVASSFKRFFPQVKLIGRATGSDIQTFPEIKYGLRLNTRIDQRIRRSLPSFDKLVANSESLKVTFLELGVKSSEVSVIPNALDLERFKLSPSEIHRVRQKWCGDSESKIILTVGRNEERKNFPFFIESLEQVFPKVDQRVKVVFVGEGTEKLAELVSTSDYQDRYFFLGRLPKESVVDYDHYPPKELIELFCASTVFTLPSKMEGQPNVLLEALAAGLPAVVGDVPGSRDVIKKGETGFLVNLDSADEYGDALVRLLTEEALHQQMSSRATAEAAQYNWRRVVGDYLDLYGKKLDAHMD